METDILEESFDTCISLAPPSIISPGLLESHHVVTGAQSEESESSVLTPGKLQKEKELFIRSFQERILSAGKQSKQSHSILDEEFVCKLISESEEEATSTTPPPPPSSSAAAHPPIPPPRPAVYSEGAPKIQQVSISRLSIRSTGQCLSPPPSSKSNASKKRFSNRISPNNILLKESLLHQFQQQAEETKFDFERIEPYQNQTLQQPQVRTRGNTASEITTELINEDYDSDYWEDERLLLKWEARRLGLIYFGVDELQKHKETTKLTAEARMQLLFR